MQTIDLKAGSIWNAQHSQDKAGKAGRLPLEKYCKEYISVHRKGDQQAYLVRRLAAKASFAAFALTNLREHHLQAFIKERRKFVSEKTVREDILAISHLYKYAVAHWEGCAGLKNPAKDIPFRQSDNKRERRLKSAAASGRSDGLSEEQALLMACEKSRAPWLRDAIELLIETAMRRGELAALQWGWIDFDERLIRLPAEVTKTSTAREIPMTRRAKEILWRMAPRELWLPASSPERRAACAAPVIPADGDYMYRCFKEACRSVGIEDLRLHDLRHEAASRFGEMRLTTREIMAITGHKTHQMVVRYTHLSGAHMRDVLDRLAEQRPQPAPSLPANDDPPIDGEEDSVREN